MSVAERRPEPRWSSSTRLRASASARVKQVVSALASANPMARQKCLSAVTSTPACSAIWARVRWGSSPSRWRLWPATVAHRASWPAPATPSRPGPGVPAASDAGPGGPRLSTAGPGALTASDAETDSGRAVHRPESSAACWFITTPV